MLGRLATAGKRGAWAWEVELWPCGYVAKCSALGCHRRAATILPISTPGTTRSSYRCLRYPREQAVR
jgi:hypothetical protein